MVASQGASVASLIGPIIDSAVWMEVIFARWRARKGWIKTQIPAPRFIRAVDASGSG
jgi:hypothetical protein